MYAAVVIHDGEAILATTAATESEAMTKLRAAYHAEQIAWHESEEAAKDAVQQDEDAGDLVFCTCRLAA